MTEKRSYNLAHLDKQEMDKVNVDMAAASVAYKERMNMPVIPAKVEGEQLDALRAYFRERLEHHRATGQRLPRGTDPVYHKMAEANGKK